MPAWQTGVLRAGDRASLVSWTLQAASGLVALGAATIPVWLALGVLAVFGTVLPYLAGRTRSAGCRWGGREC
ncbi:hypothetical protein [Amycolatopsis silviterrae]|uniref:Uncharacterized protein n=1 Tax=Amycolatopsis silviterrae TaxID=1656914 RepID=A0ABW5HB81_9PSEU